MTAKEFFYKVAELREAQKRYFRIRSSRDLSICRKLEQEIDNEINRVKNLSSSRFNQQLFLFNEKSNGENHRK